MADEAKSSGDIDDWLADLDEESGEAGAVAPAAPAAPAGELDQSDIDALLGNPVPAAGGAPVAAGEGALELDQSDIDSLFGEASPAAAVAATPPATAPAEAVEDLSQAGIDELLGGGSAPAAVGTGEGGLAQDDIDSLFASSPPAKESPLAEGEETPSQEEMDALFGSIGMGPAEEATLAASTPAVAASGSAAVEEPEVDTTLHKPGSSADDFTLDDDSGFASDAFAFDDSIPDIPDETTLSAAKPAPAPKAAGAVKEDIFAEPGAAQEDLSALLAAGEETIGTKGGGKPSTAMSSSISKSTIGIACLVMLALGGGAYYFMTRPKTVSPPPPLPVTEPAKPAAPSPSANHPPTVKDEEVKIDEASNTAAINLTAQDADNDKLQFEIVKPPEHGRLSGEPPQLTYLPNPDFPGEDTIEFLASDGKDASPPGHIHIVGKDLRQQAVAKKEECQKGKAARPVVRAVDMVLTTMNGRPLVIDWQRVWKKANRSAYGRTVQVEIVGSGLRGGELIRLGPSRSRYQPERYFTGTEVIRYRFHKGGIASPTRQLLVRVVPGGAAPQLVLKPLARAYQVGETVVLDARATRSATPDALTFKWEQVGGTAILLEPMNPQSSAVAFIMPSYFHTERAPQPVVQVTAIDAFGRRVSRTITVGVEPKRSSPNALWRGTPDGEVAPDPSLPQGAYPGQL